MIQARQRRNERNIRWSEGSEGCPTKRTQSHERHVISYRLDSFRWSVVSCSSSMTPYVARLQLDVLRMRTFDSSSWPMTPFFSYMLDLFWHVGDADGTAKCSSRGACTGGGGLRSCDTGSKEEMGVELSIENHINPEGYPTLKGVKSRLSGFIRPSLVNVMPCFLLPIKLR